MLLAATAALKLLRRTLLAFVIVIITDVGHLVMHDYHIRIDHHTLVSSLSLRPP